jgi:hypothetical protein
MPKDFGFAPGSDSHSNDLRSLFSLRPNTTLIAKSGVTSVRKFVQHLNTTSSVTKPIGDLVLGMHANDEGQLKIPMFPGQAGDWAKFEALEQSLTDSSKSIAIPDTMIGFTPGDPITHALHLKGCNIGLAQPFLVKLKEALGSHVNVTAPNFFHGATSTPQGVFEYIGYYFKVPRPELFPLDATRKRVDRAKALSEFDTAQFPLIDDSIVPTADWDKIIPANPNVERRTNVQSQLGTSIGKRTTVKTPSQYRVTRITFGPWTVPFPDAASVPRNESDQLLELEIHLKTDKRFQETHPFPQWQREGFANLTAFVSGYKWRCVPSGKSLICNGERFLFIVVVAVNDPATRPATGIFTDGNLLFNFYPNPGTGFSAITNTLEVTNTKFFVTV